MKNMVRKIICVAMLLSMFASLNAKALVCWVLDSVEEVTTDDIYVKGIGSGDSATAVIGEEEYFELDVNGEFSIKIPKQKLGTKIEVYTSGDGAIDSESIFIKTQLQKATAKKVKAKAKKITGTGYAGSKVKIYKGKKFLGKATCNKKGKYTAKIAKPNLLKKGVKLKLISTAKAKGEKYTSEAVVKVK